MIYFDIKDYSTPLNFDNLKHLHNTTFNEITDLHNNSLLLFEEKDENGKIVSYLHRITDPKDKKASITSTCTSIKSFFYKKSILSKKDFAPFIHHIEERITNEKITSSGLENNNPFTIGLLVSTIAKLQVNLYHADIQMSDYIKTLLKSLLPNLENILDNDGVCVVSEREHAYLTYWCLVSLDETNRILKDDGIDFKKIIERCVKWSELEFYKQISFFNAGDDVLADAFHLGYNILIQYKYNRANIRDSLIKHGLQVLFNAQLKKGIWEKKEPIFYYNTSGKGDAYCFPFELFSSILYEFQSDFNYLKPYEENFLLAVDWAIKNAQYVTNDDDVLVPLWKSGNLVSNEPESWATAEVFAFFHLFNKYLSSRIQESILSEYKAEKYLKPDENALIQLDFPDIFFPKDYQSSFTSDRTIFKFKVADSKPEYKPVNLKTILETTIFKKLERNKNYSFDNTNPKKVIRSGIFFGPPGTGKTTLVKCIAKYMGWPLITINPSEFARKGFAMIPSTSAEIFDKLIELKDVVIFFDEMDELIKNRSNEDSGFEQRFLTTSFLPHLQDLHDRAKCIFIVATNYFIKIDEAIRREGRFDFKFQILPPSIDSKINVIKSKYHDNKVLVEYLETCKTTSNDNSTSIALMTRPEFLNFAKLRLDNKDSINTYLDEFKPSLVKDKLKEWVGNNDYNSIINFD